MLRSCCYTWVATDICCVLQQLVRYNSLRGIIMQVLCSACIDIELMIMPRPGRLKWLNSRILMTASPLFASLRALLKHTRTFSVTKVRPKDHCSLWRTIDLYTCKHIHDQPPSLRAEDSMLRQCNAISIDLGLSQSHGIKGMKSILIEFLILYIRNWIWGTL